ncbi:hypothetical protein ACHAWF_008479 [Thalassiosira exigua]
MPFFYSQYLKDERRKGAQSGAAQAKTQQRRPTSNVPRRKSLTRGGSGRLVWHSNIGSSGVRGKQSNFKPLDYGSKGKGKKSLTVHFSTIEVQPFHFDWTVADDVFYTRRELTAMGQSRFEDAAKLRKQRHLDDAAMGGVSRDDVGISACPSKSKKKDISTLLALALDDKDRDESVSIRGIEHFVYPDLQQEMIRKKKEVQREVLDFVRSKRPDPQGWRLAQHSRNFSQWARNVAMEKGMKYSIQNAEEDPDVVLTESELQRFQMSKDEIESSERNLRGSSSFAASITLGSSSSYDIEPSSDMGMKLQGIKEAVKMGQDGTSHETQPAGVDTGED